MTTELYYLVLVTALTALMWVPYILNMIAIRGLLDAVGYPENPEPMASWAVRMKAAHANAVENLVIFAALVLAAHAVGLSNSVTQTACIVYFWTRLVHLIAYTFKIPWVRTLAFAVGFFAQIAIAWQLLGAQSPPL